MHKLLWLVLRAVQPNSRFVKEKESDRKGCAGEINSKLVDRDHNEVLANI